MSKRPNPWLTHVAEVRKNNVGKSQKEIMKIASDLYKNKKSGEGIGDVVTKVNKRLKDSLVYEGEVHLPYATATKSHNYCGPMTAIDKRIKNLSEIKIEDLNNPQALMRKIKFAEGAAPANQIDTCCLIHDLYYTFAMHETDPEKRKKIIFQADNILMGQLKNVKPKTNYERLAKAEVQGAFKGKRLIEHIPKIRNLLLKSYTGKGETHLKSGGAYLDPITGKVVVTSKKIRNKIPEQPDYKAFVGTVMKPPKKGGSLYDDKNNKVSCDKCPVKKQRRTLKPHVGDGIIKS